MLYDKRWDAKVEPKESEVIERLKRARARVASKWCQKVGSLADGSVCMQSAIGGEISHADYLRGSGGEAFAFVERAIGWDNIVGWNDAPGRTQAEVVAAFDKAIELARAFLK